ncbi:helix-turn-helix domain-containing protein [Cereibacter changlensis]|uniref:helix-turn-helix domain-containing protein n=1 Tax=Cereibacter changlensis TaxID=402884 RepID=UPI00403476DA
MEDGAAHSRSYQPRPAAGKHPARAGEPLSASLAGGSTEVVPSSRCGRRDLQRNQASCTSGVSRPSCGRNGAGVDLAARTLRIEEAKQMLATTDVLIDAIAAEVGCTETAAFRRMFKRATGLAPLPIGRGALLQNSSCKGFTSRIHAVRRVT